VSVVDAATNTVTKDDSNGKYPDEIGANPVHQTKSMPRTRGYHHHSVDGATPKHTHTVTVERIPWSLAVNSLTKHRTWRTPATCREQPPLYSSTARRTP